MSNLNRSTGRNLSVGGYLFNCKTMKPMGVSLQADLSLDICLSFIIIVWMLIYSMIFDQFIIATALFGFWRGVSNSRVSVMNDWHSAALLLVVTTIAKGVFIMFCSFCGLTVSAEFPTSCLKRNHKHSHC